MLEMWGNILKQCSVKQAQTSHSYKRTEWLNNKFQKFVDDVSLLDISYEEKELNALTLVESVATKETIFEVHTKPDQNMLCSDDVTCDSGEQPFDKESDLNRHVHSQHDSIRPQSQNPQSNIVVIENATFYCKTCGNVLKNLIY